MTADTLVAVSGVLRDLSLSAVVGALLLIAVAIPKQHPAADRAALVGRIASIVWVASALTYSLATYAYIRDSPVDPNRFLEEWWSYSNSVDLLQAHRQVIIAALVTSVMIGPGTRPNPRRLVAGARGVGDRLAGADGPRRRLGRSPPGDQFHGPAHRGRGALGWRHRRRGDAAPPAQRRDQGRCHARLAHRDLGRDPRHRLRCRQRVAPA